MDEFYYDKDKENADQFKRAEYLFWITFLIAWTLLVQQITLAVNQPNDDSIIISEKEWQECQKVHQ